MPALAPGTVLLSDGAGRFRLFADPLRVISPTGAHEVPDALREADRALSEGLYLAGWLGYELGHCLDTTGCLPLPEQTLAWLGCYRDCRLLDSSALREMAAGGHYARMPM